VSPVPEGRHRGLPLHWGLVEIKVNHYQLKTEFDFFHSRNVPAEPQRGGAVHYNGLLCGICAAVAYR